MTTDTAALELSYVKTIGMTSNSPTGRGFANPIDLAFTQDGRILVMNRGEYVFSRVTICDLDEEYFGEIGSDGEGDGQFRMPSSIAVDSKGNVYTADEYLHRITVFDSSGGIRGQVGRARVRPRADRRSVRAGDRLRRQRLRCRPAQRPGPEVHLRRLPDRWLGRVRQRSGPVQPALGHSAWTRAGTSTWPTGATTASRSSRPTASP